MSDQEDSMAPAMVGEGRATLVVGGSVGAIVPQSVEEVWRLSNVFHRSGMAPTTLNTPEKVMVSILAGAELGLLPFQAMQSFAVIGGRPVLFGDGMLAVIRSRGFRIKEWFAGSAEERIAFCEVTRPDTGETVKRSFSVEDAKTAGLWKKSGPWTTNPFRMLQMRVRAFACRDAASDVLRGFQMREEVEDYAELRDVTPPRPTVKDRLQARTERPVEGFTVENGDHLSSAASTILDDNNFPLANQDETAKPTIDELLDGDHIPDHLMDDPPKPAAKRRGRPPKVREEAAPPPAVEPPSAPLEAPAEPVLDAEPSSTGEAATPALEPTTVMDAGTPPIGDGTGLNPAGIQRFYDSLRAAGSFADIQSAFLHLRRSETYVNARAIEQRAWQADVLHRLDLLAEKGVDIPTNTANAWIMSLWLNVEPDPEVKRVAFQEFEQSDAYKNLSEEQKARFEEAMEAGQ